jgi:hypothetical protein
MCLAVTVAAEGGAANALFCQEATRRSRFRPDASSLGRDIEQRRDDHGPVQRPALGEHKRVVAFGGSARLGLDPVND